MCEKRKVAVFVEGQTELVFVREMLLKWYSYSQIGIACIALHGGKEIPVEYDFGDSDQDYFFQIINVGNDNSVLSNMLKRAKSLMACGFCAIIGLRDMFCDQYHKLSQRTIKDDINNRFYNAACDEIKQYDFADRLILCFAIMEVEAWILGMSQCIHEKLNVSDFSRVFDESCDPEVTIYHPANVINDIFGLVGKSYDKHNTDVNSIVSFLEKKDFQDLYKSGKCESFRLFLDALLGTDIN